MNIKYISVVTVAMAFSTASFAAPKNDNNAQQNRMSRQPTSEYWQAPNWSNIGAPPVRSSNSSGPARPSSRNNNNRPPAAPNYRQPYPTNNYPARNNNRPVMNQPDQNRAAPPQQMQNAYRGNPNPPQRGPHPGANRNQYYPDNAQPAYNHPGYRSYGNNNARNNNRRDNRFWGNSGPNRWMNPNKGNLGRGWDDMTNGPGRMGEMPGGWRAPQISTPNPVDMGDQVQDNVDNMPDQMRDMRR